MDGSRERIRAEFAKRQGRQSVAVVAAMLLVVVFAMLYARPGWLGPNSRATIFSAQIVVIAAFIGFTYHNWRCPACNRHLGGDLHRHLCRKCRARLG
jgi:preprotein translocase subunit SecD